jgi:hypothetical protein
MAEILLPGGRMRRQPQYLAPLDQSHWLTKDVTFALNGAVPYFNAAKGRSSGLSAGGSGFSRQVTQRGISLYTPNGGWADFALNEDWAGPNTVIALCRINGIDNPWGGLFSKQSSGTSAQFAVGQYGSEDVLYGQVDGTAAERISGTAVSTITGFNVLAFTHSGVTTTGLSYYRNGALVGATPNLLAQATGSGPLGLGRARDSTAGFDSDVDWVGFIRVRRVLSAAEIAEISRNIWAPWKAPARRIWVSSGTSYTLTADPGSFSATGTAASLKYGRVLQAASGSFAVTGTAATLKKGYSLQAGSGSFSATGTAATLRYGRVIQAAAGSFGVTGTDASLKYGRVLAAQSGTFQITGTDATLTYGTAGSYTLTAQSGSFSVSGTAATLRYGRKLSADSGSFAFTGTAASLRYARKIIAEAGTFSLTGTAATLTYSGSAGPVASTVERTAIFRAIVARSTKFQRSKSVTVRFN